MVLSVSPSRWNGTNIRSRSVSGMPGPRSTTRSSTRSPSALRGQQRRLARRGVAAARSRQVDDDPLQEGRVGTSTSGSDSGMSTVTTRPAGPRSSSAPGTISSSPAGRGNSDSAPACSRLMSSRLSTRRVSRSSDSSAVASSSSRSSAVPVHVRRAQAGHRGLGRGQRGAQVVADRGEQRGPHPVGLGDRLGRLGLGGQPLLVQRDRGLGGERAEHPAVLGGQRPARAAPATACRRPAPRRRPRPAGSRPARRGWRRRASARRAPIARGGVGGRSPGDVRSSSVTESMPNASRTRSSSARQRPLAAQHAAGRGGQQLGLGAGPGRLPGAPGGEVHHRADQRARPRRTRRARARCSPRRW